MKRVTGMGGIFFKAKDPARIHEGNRIELWEPAGEPGQTPAGKPRD